MFPSHRIRHYVACWASLSRPACRQQSGGGLVALHRFQRSERLKEIYKPFDKLIKSTKEYQELARSGQVWENYFKPGDSKKLGYFALQRVSLSISYLTLKISHSRLQDLAETLEKIDNLKQGMSIPVDMMAKNLIAEYAHQSVQIEGSQVNLGDSVLIDNELNDKLFRNIDLGNFSVDALISLELPKINTQSRDSSQIAELTNHIVISRWIAEVASRAPGTAGLTESEIHTLSAITLKGTASEAIYNLGWGTRVSLGDYRITPISVKFNHLRIFPYHVEVPALMKRFFRWRNEVHNDKELHPLIVACQMIAYFLHIHPFPDGNGRLGRMLLHDYMVRQGYLPIVMINLGQQDYLQMISDAQDGKPANFVLQVLETQLDEMLTCSWRS